MEASVIATTMDVDGMTRFSDLPSCLIIDILLRLPLKTLQTCRCVCKDWIQLLRDPYFITASPIHILNRVLRRGRTLEFFQVTKDLQVKTVSSRSKINLPNSTSKYLYGCINSCNGLLCLTDEHPMCPLSRVYLCNPLLGESVLISIPSRDYSCPSILALVFSEKNNQYKLLHGFKAGDYGFEVYTLGTRRWRSIDETLGCRPCGRFPYHQDFNTFLHGSLHWSVNDTEEFICCFDADSEKFRRLSLPPARIKPGVQLGTINGCLLALCFSLDEICDAEIWVMKEYGVEKSWNMMVTIWGGVPRDSPPGVMSYGGGLKCPILLSSLNEEEILINDRSRGILSYNLKRNMLRSCMSWKTIDFDFVTAYTPSFISLQDVAMGEEVKLLRAEHTSNPIEDGFEDFEFTTSENL